MPVHFFSRLFIAFLILGFSDLSYADTEQGIGILLNNQNQRYLTKISKQSKNLKNFPNASNLLQSKTVLTSSAKRIGYEAVSGTPPTVVEIANAVEGIKNVFWRPGVIDALANGTLSLPPSPTECSEYRGEIDGYSGGLGACHMAEGVGYSFQTILEGGISLCFMQNFPTQANLDAAGVQLIQGEFPGGKIKNLFLTPTTTKPRIVKVNVTGSEENAGPGTVFLRIKTSTQNGQKERFYKADIWFCKSGSTGSPNGYNLIEVNADGEFKTTQAHVDAEESRQFISKSSGKLKFKDGALTFDKTEPRTAYLEALEQNGSFKSSISISGNVITTKSKDTFGGEGNVNNNYAVSEFSGSGDGLNDLRFISGAFKNKFSNGSEIVGGTEWRDNLYVAANTSLTARVSNINFDSDKFYDQTASAVIDLSPYSCTELPDIELNIDMSNPTLAASIAPCEKLQNRGMHFCHDDEAVRQADTNFFNLCLQH